MSEQNMSRRRFMAVAGGVPVASLSTPPTLSWLLENHLGSDRVYAILQPILDLQPRDMQVVRSFYQSLLSIEEHGKNAEELRALLLDSSKSEELAQYLLEEFVTTTNYLEIRENREGTLVFLGIPS